MGSTGFASARWGTWSSIVDLEDIKDYAAGYGLIDGYPGNGYDDSFPYETNKHQTIVENPSGVIKMGKVYAVDEPGLNIDLWNYMFQGVLTEYGNSGSTVNYVYAPDLDRMYTHGYIKLNTLYPKTSDVNSWAAYDAVAVSGWTRADLAVKLGLSSGTDSTTMANNAQKLGDYFYSNSMMRVVEQKTNSSLYFETMFNANSLGFTGGPIISSTNTEDGRRRLTITEIQKSGIKLNVQISGNSGPVKKCELVPSKGLIEFRLKDEWVSTKDTNFEVVMHLTIDGKRKDDESVTITGTLDNKRIKVYANMDFVDISEGYIAEPVEFNTKIAVDVGNGVTIHTKMFKDKLYYGTTTREDDEEATIVYKQYKDVSNVIRLNTVGFANTNDYVTFSTDYAGYYVYDADLNYLGKADEQVAFSTRYYLADQKLDLADDEDDDDDDDDTEEPSQAGNPSTGGDNTSPNINANPGTGR